jgi:hypothetical protein
MSLFNSSFIICVVIFNSYISFFIEFFVLLWYLLKSSLRSFIYFYVFHVLYFWCLEMFLFNHL